MTLGGTGTQTINVTGGDGYSLTLGNIASSGAVTLNPTTANLTVGAIGDGGTSTSAVTFSGSGNTTVTGIITNAAGKTGNPVNFTSTGIVTLDGANTINGTFSMSSGTVVANNNSAIIGAVKLGTTTASSTAAATLLLGGTDTAGLTGGITMSKTIAAQDTTSGTLTIGGQNTSGINTYSAAITLGATANTGKSVNLVAATGGEVDFTTTAIANNGTDTTAGITVNNPYTVSGVTVTPTGTVTLTAANTYAGGTTIFNGKLRLGNGTGTSATGTGVVNLGSLTVGTPINATISGTGFSTGLLTAVGGARIAPGVNTTDADGSGRTNFGGVGTLTLGSTGGMTLTSASLDFDLVSTAAGVSDRIATGGTTTLGTMAFTFNETGGSLQTGTLYTLISGGTISGNTSGITTTAYFNGTAYTALYTTDATDLFVTFSPVPEPGTWAMAAGGAGLLVALARRRRAL